MSLNIFPFALNVCAGQSLHFSNSLALFFSCSNADATTSALGMSRSSATEKRVDLFREAVEPQFDSRCAKLDAGSINDHARHVAYKFAVLGDRQRRGNGS